MELSRIRSPFDKQPVIAALKECSRTRDLETGRKIHENFVKTNNVDIVVECTLVDMYAKCGSLTDAMKVFESMQQKNVVTWNIMIQGYAQNGHGDFALHLFFQMQPQHTCHPNHVTFLAALKACITCAEKEQSVSVENGKLVKLECLAKGRKVHSLARRTGHDQHIFVASRLLDMYFKCGCTEDARDVFEKLSQKDLVCWNASIMGYAECGEGEEALELYTRLQRQEPRVTPNYVTHLAALKACVSCAEKEEARLVDGKLVKARCLEKGKAIHSQTVQPGVKLHLFVASTLVDMYSKCGSMVDARKIFESMTDRTVVTWTAMIQGYAENGEGELAFQLYTRMRLHEGIKPNDITYTAMLKACMSLAEKAEEGNMTKVKSQGKLIHSEVAATGYEMHVVVANALVDMYGRCGSMVDSGLVFSSMVKPSVVTWTGMISGCAQSFQGDIGLQLLDDMQEQGCKPDAVTFVAAVKACGSVQAQGRDDIKARNERLARLRGVHAQVLAAEGVEVDGHLGSTLVDVYSKFGSPSEARSVFEEMKRRDFVTWNCMLSGYAQGGGEELHRALELYHTMLELGITPDAVTFVAVLKACGNLAMTKHGKVKSHCLEQCRLAHSHAARAGMDSHTFVGNMLIDAYSKCGSMDSSWRIFQSFWNNSNVVSWTALIVACVDSDDPKRALSLVGEMKCQAGVEPDAVTYVAALEACGMLADVETGRRIETRVRDAGFHKQVVVANALVDLYGKCGAVDEAWRVFESTRGNRNLITWNALLDGYSRQGDLQQVISLFEKMQEDKFEPNDVTFLSILTACSHSGSVDKGKEYFEVMQSPRYRIIPGVKHYTCMADLLGRANRLEEALEIISRMPCKESDSVVPWTTLLGICHKWKNVSVGRIAFESVLKLQGDHTSAYVLMSNIYATTS